MASRQIRLSGETFEKLVRISGLVGKEKYCDLLTSIVDSLESVLLVAGPDEMITISIGNDPERKFILPIRRAQRT